MNKKRKKNQQSKNCVFKQVLPITTVRRNIFAIAEDVVNNGKRYIITEHGHPTIMISPACNENIQYVSSDTVTEEAFMMADDCQNRYRGVKKNSPNFFVHDRYYGEVYGKKYIPGSREVIRSCLTVALLEQYKYPLSHLAVGYSIEISENRFIQSDIIVHDGRGNVQIVFIVTQKEQFDEGSDGAVHDLYAVAKAFKRQGQQGPNYLFYYTRDVMQQEKCSEQMIGIDYKKYPTKHSWQCTGKKSLDRIPMNISE